jgi:hypothetical protein
MVTENKTSGFGASEQHHNAFVHHNARFDLHMAQLSVTLILLALSLLAAAQLFCAAPAVQLPFLWCRLQSCIVQPC